MNAIDLLELLNDADELENLEAKRGGKIGDSVMETVCAFANTPDLGGGTLILGVERREADNSLFPYYEVVGVPDPDKLQSDLASQCASRFNHRIRPTISIEQVDGKSVLVAVVPESPNGQKPIYFKAKGLPGGALLRVGPTDQRCTEDDLEVFYTDRDTYDATLLDGTGMQHVDPEALRRYRTLRAEVNAGAEELALDDSELLESLNCKAIGPDTRLTVAGVILFGTGAIIRRLFPMMRLDYIRVPGNVWMSDLDASFTNLDLRGALFLTLPRMVNEVYADLPRAFQLREGELQASTVGLPSRALREALTNAVMHRSYRVQSAIQIIRYNNRIEVINPGYSLKSEEQLGSPKSVTRNGVIAAAFHETNLAETKGTGIRRMRNLLRDAGLSAPTFQSSRRDDDFTARLLLHHFFTPADLAWLSRLAEHKLAASQQQAIVFLREVGAIDTLRYRQLTGQTPAEARTEIKALVDAGLVQQKGRGRGTYYAQGKTLIDSWATFRAEHPAASATDGEGLITPGDGPNTEPRSTSTVDEDYSTEPRPFITEPPVAITEPPVAITEAPAAITEPQPTITEPPAAITGRASIQVEPTNFELLLATVDQAPVGKTLKADLAALKPRISDPSEVEVLVLALCKSPRSVASLSKLLGRNEDYLLRRYLKPLIDAGRLTRLFPDLPNHPSQAYVTPQGPPT